MRVWRVLVLAVVVSTLVVAGCVPPTPVSQTPGGQGQAPRLEKLTLGLGYIPSVQFAPFYVALQKGFFAKEGLDVTFRHGMETDFIKLVGTNELQFAVASGEEVILARAQGLPVTYVMTWYQRFPVVVFAPKGAGLDTPKALEGHKVGIPGLYGASFVAWKALVYAAGIDESKVTLESIGYTQAEAVSQGRVDAAIDYAVNGPVKLRLAGQDVDVISVSDYIDLPSNGLVTNEQTIRDRPDLVQRVVRATLKGLEYTLAHPDEAFAISLKAVPEAGGENEPTSRAVFDMVLDEWRIPQGRKLGWTDPQRWEQAVRFMRKMGLIDVDVDASVLFTNQFVESP
ncbi:MAG: ABC transporter substrate-binding protein [Anaerolineae bacterium]|nr:ABC transporter substrate-binding protein [Anaerolineae bacterium]